MSKKVAVKEQKREEKALAKSPTKKQQIAALWQLGITGIDELAHLTGTRSSYVASVLQGGGGLRGYFDLYTTSGEAMNVYSKYFAGKLGFKDVPTARRSVHYLNTLYKQFERISDRAGQHHAMVMGLTMFNRARWSGKVKEAKVFEDWLTHAISDAEQASRLAMVEG